MEKIINSIVYDEKSIFILYGNNNKLYDIWNYFLQIGAVILDESRILQGRPRYGYSNKDNFYKTAYSKFLVLNDFNNFKMLSPSKLKEIVSGNDFQIGKIFMQESILVEHPSKKKLIIFAGETIPNETIFDTEKDLEALTQIYHL